MSNKQFRRVTRILHIVAGVMIAIFIYSPLRNHDVYLFFIQFIITPSIMLSGIMLWQQVKILKWLKKAN